MPPTSSTAKCGPELEDAGQKDLAIQELRDKIDQIDNQIVELLNQRAQNAITISSHKKSNGLSVFCPEREKSVLKRLDEINRGPLPTKFIEQIFSEIISACREVQRPLGWPFWARPAPSATWPPCASSAAAASSPPSLP